eukprot:1178136-Prorocentrum_minimum.AAC.4
MKGGGSLNGPQLPSGRFDHDPPSRGLSTKSRFGGGNVYYPREAWGLTVTVDTSIFPVDRLPLAGRQSTPGLAVRPLTLIAIETGENTDIWRPGLEFSCGFHRPAQTLESAAESVDFGYQPADRTVVKSRDGRVLPIVSRKVCSGLNIRDEPYC